jgi:hypothetical protein
MQFRSGDFCGHSGIRWNSAGMEITILAGSTAKIPFCGIPGIDWIPPDSGRNTRRTIKHSTIGRVIIHCDARMEKNKGKQ